MTQNPRVYQVWQHVGGNNRFFCRGCCVTGPRIDIGYNMCAWCSILIPTAFYFAYCASHLWLHVTMWMPILTGLALASTIVFFLLTSFTDPGIIPRHAHQVAVEGLVEEVAGVIGAGAPSFDGHTLEPLCEITRQQDAMGYRWCPTCKVVRPPRASHCRDCDSCVMQFDHHCPFVNNCIGQRNYAFFVGFLVSTGCLGVAIAVGTYVRFSQADSSGEHVEISKPLLYLLYVVGAVVGVLLLCVLGLTLFHSWLACRGHTTKEALTGKVTVSGRTLFASRGRSLLHARDRVSYPLSVI